MAVRFRNVDVPKDVAEWPFEAIVTVIERGTVSDWVRLTREVARDPWGRAARQLEDYLPHADDPAGLLRRRLAIARAEAAAADRDQVAQTVRDLVARSGLSQEAFARRIGTSRSRLSTYCSGKVTPSAALLLRMERLAASAAGPRDTAASGRDLAAGPGDG